jgi:dipeptidyl aminopeptidase/acylaminoacyl peptidase
LFSRDVSLQCSHDEIISAVRATPGRNSTGTSLMRSSLQILIVTALFSLLTTTVRGVSELVIAVRYLQATGTGHAHLYLYGEDGKLLRQLTNDDSGQESAPIFSPDGNVIVFTREKANQVREFWSIDPRGTNLKKLDGAPDWYTEAKSSPYFTNIEPSLESVNRIRVEKLSLLTNLVLPLGTYKSPDGSVELILRLDFKDEDDQINGPGHGKHYLLRDPKTGAEMEFGKVPGFYGAAGLLHDSQDKDQHFLFDGSFRLAFFDLHLNSTDGDTVFALDLSGPRFVRLSPNWATPIPLPGEAAFLTFTENRCVPIPNSKKTANCSYIERWDEKLNHIRYAREKSAALCYGMSMYRPGKNPAVISMRRSAD